MLRKLLKNKKAQNTAEYAILISLVVAGIIAMQTYAQRALQARVRDASQYLATETSTIGGNVQYEPYYLNTSYNVVRDEETSQFLSNTQTTSFENSDRTRTGGSTTTYTGVNSY
jgi:Flp pilus assembly pilin Flp